MYGLNYVYLDKDKDYVYCFAKENVILEEDCDYYEHNLECDENNDFYHRTHRKGTLAGYNYAELSGNVLNSCKYCVENAKTKEKYWLPQDAKINKKSGFLRNLINRIFQ